MGRHWCSSIQWNDRYRRLGLEKSLSFPSGARSPWGEQKGGSQKFLLGLSLLQDLLLADHHSPERRAVREAGHPAPLALGPHRAAHQTIWPISAFGLWTWFKGRLPRAKSPSKIYLLPDSKPQIAPAQQCGWWSVLTFPEEPDTSSSLLDTRDIKVTWEAREPLFKATCAGSTQDD